MTAGFLAGSAAELELLLRATLLIGAAWAGAATLRKSGASASARHSAWLLGVGALLALPLLWWLAPALRLPILGPEAAVAVDAAFPPPVAAAASTPPGAAEDWGSSDVLLSAYAIGAVLLLVRIAIFRLMLSRLWRDARPARDAEWDDLLARVSREMRLARPVELRISRGPAMPMTWGTLAPKVLLPAEAGAWPPERRRLVLLHELAHVARRDSLSRSAASLACALYWFHPGAWFAARQLRIEQEHAADDRVLTAGAPARSYALSLVDLARGFETRSDHAAAMAGMCHLERRLVSITTPARRELPGPAFLFSSTALALLVTLIVAAGVPVPSSTLPAALQAEPEALVPAAAAADPGRTGGRLNRETRAAGSAETLAAAAIGSPGGRDAAAIATPPEARTGGRAPEAAARRTEAPPQGQPIVARADMAADQGPGSGRRLAAYGPTLPRADADDDSARIPEVVRQRRRSEPERSGSALPDLGIRLVPQDGDRVGRPGLSVALVPVWP